MMTANEARAKFEQLHPAYKHIEEKAERLITDAIQCHFSATVYELDTTEEDKVWGYHTTWREKCNIVCSVLERYGYTTTPYANLKKVAIAW